MKKLKDSYKIRLRCATCGCDDQFEFNEDKSYVKCTFCKLKELNQDAFDEVKEKIEDDAASYLKEELAKALNGCKNIKFK